MNSPPEASRRWDPIALTALILSLIAAIAQLVAWVRASEVRLIPTDRVALYSQLAPDGTIAIRIAAPLSYANVAQPAYGDLAVVEYASFSVGNTSSRQRWNAFGEIKQGAVSRTMDATPQPLAGQSAVSHITLFTPVPQYCDERDEPCDPTADYVDPAELMKATEASDRIQFQFTVEMFGGEVLTSRCHIKLSPLVRQQLRKLVQTPLYAVCLPN